MRCYQPGLPWFRHFHTVYAIRFRWLWCRIFREYDQTQSLPSARYRYTVVVSSNSSGSKVIDWESSDNSHTFAVPMVMTVWQTASAVSQNVDSVWGSLEREDHSDSWGAPKQFRGCDCARRFLIVRLSEVSCLISSSRVVPPMSWSWMPGYLVWVVM